ncbi:MAG TPA: DUF4198 domain-containing protein [Candidatus Tectomicrobia bacterium]
MFQRSLCSVVVLLLCAVGVVQAHFIWVEYDSNGPARAYFGEWAEDVREKAGGALDRIKTPHAFSTSPHDPLPIQRRTDHLEIAIKGDGDIRLVENGMALRDNPREGGKTRTIFYARAGRSETVGKLDLELVPTTANSNAFVLLFQGAPLAKTGVTVLGPPKWEKPLRTDEQGRITVPTPWTGRYVLTVIYVEDKAGSTGGENFDRTRHVATLSFMQPDGQPWP